MKIKEYNDMMSYLTRPGKVLGNNINNKKINDTGARTALKRGSSDTKGTPKKAKILEYIDDNIAMYEPETATKEQLEGLEKRLANARAYASPDAKKMSKTDEYNTYFNKKSPKYYNKKVADKSKSNGKYTIPETNLDSFDWDLWLRDKPNYMTLEDEDKKAGLGDIEQDLANEYWQEQYQNYLNQGGALNYQQFMQQQMNLKVSREINKRVKDKQRTEGLAAILGVPGNKI